MVNGQVDMNILNVYVLENKIFKICEVKTDRTEKINMSIHN